MYAVPKDTSELLLAPIALRLDDQLEALAALTQDELVYWVSLQTDRPPRPGHHGQIVIDALTRDAGNRDWELSWDPRGLRLQHGSRRLVLGVSDNVRTFVADGIPAP
jgi:hypothetical protein